MPVFKYEVVDPTGAVGRGRLEATDLRDLMRRFRAEGRLVLAAEPAADGVLSGVSLAPIRDALTQSLRRVASGVRIGALALFTGQLAAMLAGGLHLVRVLNTLARESTNRHFKRVLEEVRDSVTGGSSLADAMSRHPHIFNRLYVSVVGAGELGGSLPLVLDTLSAYLEKADQVRRKVRGAVTYPAVILAVAVAVVFVMIWKIVPIFESVYARSTVELPAPTRLLILLSRLVQEWTVSTALAAALLVLLVLATIQTAPGRRLADTLKLRFPLFGPLMRKAVLARVCRTLGVLLQSGIPLIEAMETAARVGGNRVVENALMTASRQIRDGATIAETFRRAGEFPEMVVQLVATGEESGTLPAMLARAATHYEQQVDNTVSTIASLIEPILIAVVGAIAGAVIFSLYLPIFQLGQAIKGGVR